MPVRGAVQLVAVVCATKTMGVSDRDRHLRSYVVPKGKYIYIYNVLRMHLTSLGHSLAQS